MTTAVSDQILSAVHGGPGSTVVFAPDGLLSGATAATALSAGYAAALPGPGGCAFTLVRALGITRDGRSAQAIFPINDVPDDLAEAWADWCAELARPRPVFPALPSDQAQPTIMGIINVTPNSFSDGGAFIDPDRAIAHGRRLAAAGAGILDIGGESTRPGAKPVAPEEEQRRILPVIETLAAENFVISVDTRNAATAARALDAGAAIINDVTALTGDPRSLDMILDRQAPTILMHMQGDPQTMQANPRYTRATVDIFQWLAARLQAIREHAARRGLPLPPLAIDPGIGFGKNLDHNLDILSHLTAFHGLGVPVLLGASRKSFIGRLADDANAAARVPGSLAAAIIGARAGVHLLRVHDVKETVQALAVAHAVDCAG